MLSDTATWSAFIDLFTRGQNLHYTDDPPFRPTLHCQDLSNSDKGEESPSIFKVSL